MEASPKTLRRSFCRLICLIALGGGLGLFGFHGPAHAGLIDNGDGTITDTDTGLMWVQDVDLAGSPMTWNEADGWAQNLNFATYDDWRLPTGDSTQYLHGEIWTIYIVYKGFLIEGQPFSGLSGVTSFWTAAEDPDDPAKAIGSFWSGDGQLVNWDKTSQMSAWAVRTIPDGAPSLDVDVWIMDYWNDSGSEPSGKSGESVDIFVDNNFDGRIDLPSQWDAPNPRSASNIVRAYLRNKTDAWLLSRVALYRWNCETRTSIENSDRVDGVAWQYLLPPLGRKLVSFPDVSLPNRMAGGGDYCLSVSVWHDLDRSPGLPVEPEVSNNLASINIRFMTTREGDDASLYWRRWIGGWIALVFIALVVAMTLVWYISRHYYRSGQRPEFNG